MKEIYLKIKYDKHKAQLGVICSQPDTFDFNHLIKWVKRNCKGYDVAKMKRDKYIFFHYKDYNITELWSLDKEILKEIKL